MFLKVMYEAFGLIKQIINGFYDTKIELYLNISKCDGYIEVILPQLKEYEVYVLEKN